MTERDKYRRDVDFEVLALQYPEFNKFLKANRQVDFSNPQAVQSLTKSLLQRDFGLEIVLPNDRLCPPVPNRYNYILWIQDLLDCTSKTYTEQYDPERDVIGLDIGTGASCIYPLLACSQRAKWRMAATDIDGKNMEYAKQNILKNDLKSRIRPLQTKASDPLIPLDALGLDRIDFTMCNPPFYTSTEELLACAKSKARPPQSACTGAEVEMVTLGGEVAFVGQMIDESRHLRDRCQWYTSMLGKASSVEKIVQKLKDVGIQHWAVKDLVQGNKTKRWCIAWSWANMRPNEKISRASTTFSKALLPFPTNFDFTTTDSLDVAAQRLNGIMQDLSLRWQYKPSIRMGLALTGANVWSRAARRRREQGQEGMDVGNEKDVALGVTITLSTAQNSGANVRVRWLQGQDHVLFESFCGMLKRQLSAPNEA